MGVEIKFSQSFLWLDSWILANIIQLGTQSFCSRFVDFRVDPGRRLYDQMVMAARSGVANIAEGTARHTTSLETEMRLIDVARGSFDELQGDYFNYLLRMNKVPWGMGNPMREQLWKLQMDRPNYSNDYLHEAGLHILRQKRKFDSWIENPDGEVAANGLLILCLRMNRMLESQLNLKLRQFREQGGFTENMTQERLEARREKTMEGRGPVCPKCGKPMIKRMQKKGINQGREFWGCGDYPRCDGVRSI